MPQRSYCVGVHRKCAIDSIEHVFQRYAFLPPFPDTHPVVDCQHRWFSGSRRKIFVDLCRIQTCAANLSIVHSYLLTRNLEFRWGHFPPIDGTRAITCRGVIETNSFPVKGAPPSADT